MFPKLSAYKDQKNPLKIVQVCPLLHAKPYYSLTTYQKILEMNLFWGLTPAIKDNTSCYNVIKTEIGTKLNDYWQELKSTVCDLSSFLTRECSSIIIQITISMGMDIIDLATNCRTGAANIFALCDQLIPNKYRDEFTITIDVCVRVAYSVCGSLLGSHLTLILPGFF